MIFTIIIILPFWKNDLTPPPQSKSTGKIPTPYEKSPVWKKSFTLFKKVVLTASPSGWKIVLTLLEKRFNPSGKVNVTVYSIRNFRP